MGQQVGSPPVHPCHPLERGPRWAVPGPGAHGWWARARCWAALGRAGLLGRVMGTVSLQVLASGTLPRALLPAGVPGMAAGSGQDLSWCGSSWGAAALTLPRQGTPQQQRHLGAHCMGHGYGVDGSGDIATPGNAAGQQGVMGDMSSFQMAQPQRGLTSLQDLPEPMG